MIAITLIALAAGCASALMFASIVSGALISLVLFYLAPLPLMVTALGWGPIAATIGGLVAASGLGAIFGLPWDVRSPMPARAMAPHRRRPPWNGIRSAASCSGSRALPS